jgi:hypothetical protein
MKPKMCFKVLLVPLNTKIMPKIASLKLQTTEKVLVEELQLRSNISLKSSRIAIAEVLPSSCGIAIAESSFGGYARQTLTDGCSNGSVVCGF